MFEVPWIVGPKPYSCMVFYISSGFQRESQGLEGGCCGHHWCWGCFCCWIIITTSCWSLLASGTAFQIQIANNASLKPILHYVLYLSGKTNLFTNWFIYSYWITLSIAFVIVWVIAPTIWVCHHNASDNHKLIEEGQGLCGKGGRWCHNPRF